MRATLFAGVLFTVNLTAQEPRDLRTVLAGERFAPILEALDEHRLQIELAELTDTSDGRLTLRRSSLGTPARYFYPASSIKICAAVAALLKLNRINESRGTAFGLDSELSVQPLFDGDAREGPIPIRRQINELFIVSDNQAFNRLYDFVGHRELNEAMHAAGFTSCRILHRLSEFRSPADHRRTRATRLVDNRGAISTQRVRISDLLADNADLDDFEIGDAFYRNGHRVTGAFSFRAKNSISLRELQDLLIAVVRPEIATGKPGFPGLSIEQRRFLTDAMRRLPRESQDPTYDPDRYPDHYVKPLLPGVNRVVPAPHARIYNKTGRAYGFSIENAYVEDRRTGRGFFLAVVLYTNPNRTLNDDDYAYENVADPFFADLGEVVARVVIGG